MLVLVVCDGEVGVCVAKPGDCGIGVSLSEWMAEYIGRESGGSEDKPRGGSSDSRELHFLRLLVSERRKQSVKTTGRQ